MHDAAFAVGGDEMKIGVSAPTTAVAVARDRIGVSDLVGPLRDRLLVYIFTARCYADRGYATSSSVPLSVCPSACIPVTFRYRDHIG